MRSHDPETLLVHASRVRRLARQLTRAEDRAADVEQDTWVHALERPTHARDLAGWLGAVVRSSARQLGRGEARRSRREDRARVADESPSAAELVAQAEQQRQLVSAVLDLAEPYRSTVLLRYWHDRTPGQIALAQGVPAGTVRSRLHRAHAELRLRLGRRHDGKAWGAGVVGWLRRGAAPPLRSIPTLFLAMTTKLVAAALALVLLLALVLQPWTGGAPAAPAGPHLDSAVAGETLAPPSVASTRALGAAPGPRAVAGQEPVVVPATTLSGVVSDAENGAPIEGATLIGRGAEAVVTGKDGGYHVALRPDRSTILYARAEGYAEASVEVELAEGEERTLDLALQPGARIEVTVVDRESGAPLEDVDVQGDPLLAPLTRTDAGGRCVVYVREGEERFLRFVRAGYHPFHWSYPVQDPDRELSPEVPLAPTAQIEGRATDERGLPVADAEVLVIVRRGGFGLGQLPKEERERRDLPGFAGDDGLHRATARTGAEGTFQLEVLPGPDPQQVIIKRADGVAAWAEPIVVTSSKARPFVEVSFSARAHVSGRVLVGGAPRAGVGVRWRSTGGAEAGSASTDDQGRYVLADVLPGEVELLAPSLVHFGPHDPVALVAEAGRAYQQDFVVDVMLAPLAGRVRFESGDPAVGALVRARPLAGGGGDADAWTDDEGRFALEMVAGYRYHLTASLEQLEARLEEAAPAQGLELILPNLGVLEVHLVDEATGAPIEPWPQAPSFAWRIEGGAPFRWAAARADPGGPARVRAPVGVVDLRVRWGDRGYAPVVVPGVQVTAEARMMTVRMQRGVTARLAFEGGTPPGALFLLRDDQLDLARGAASGEGNVSVGSAQLWLDDLSLVDQRLRPDDRGRAVLRALAPGTYTLRAFPSDVEFEPPTIEVGQGDELHQVRWR